MLSPLDLPFYYFQWRARPVFTYAGGGDIPTQTIYVDSLGNIVVDQSGNIVVDGPGSAQALHLELVRYA